MTMRHLFSPEGENALARTLQQRPLLAFDFDGTLTPIVAHPNDARLSMGVSARLATLTTRFSVAIVTGRSVSDVRGRLGFEPQFIVGNHGAEDASDMTAAVEHSGALSRIRARLFYMLPTLEAAGVALEDKGHSLALHYRLSRDRDRALQAIEDSLADGDKALRVFGGKLVVNVVPKLAPDKAKAVRGLVRRSGASCAIFAGDDVNDEPVFASAPAGWLTIRVGQDDTRSKAQYFLDGPGETAMLLDRMVYLMTGQ